MKPRLKVPPSKSPPMDMDRAREQIAVAKLTPDQAILAAIRRKLDRLYLTTSKGIRFEAPNVFGPGNDTYSAQQFADEVRDLLERPRSRSAAATSSAVRPYAVASPSARRRPVG